MPRLEKFVVRDDRPAERRWIDKLKDGLRGFWQGPWQSSDQALARLLGDRPPVSSGVVVNDSTALGVAAFFSAVSMIASDLASLPLFLYRKLPGGGSERFESHPLNDILHAAPNPQTTSYLFRQALALNALTCGNGYAEIVRDAVGRPRELWNLLPERVVPIRERGGELTYRVDGHLILPASSVLHFRGTSPDAVIGMDTVTVAREAIGLSIAATGFGARYFSNGAAVGGVLTEGAGLTEPARENLRAAIKARHEGVERAHRWLLAPTGTAFTPVGNNARDSQLVELREFQIREMARFFRIPASKLGAAEPGLTYQNIEQRQLEYVQALRPYLVALEQEFDAKLIAPSERRIQHFEHVVDGMLRADTGARASYYSQAIGRWMTPNEIRRLENLPALPDGDTLTMPSSTAVGDANRTTAARAVLLDALERRTRRDCDRIARATTSAKLRQIVAEEFDDAAQREAFAATLRPGVRAWLVQEGRGGDTDRICAAAVKAYCDETRGALLDLASRDPDTFASALDRQVTTWRTRRASRLVDHLMEL